MNKFTFEMSDEELHEAAQKHLDKKEKILHMTPISNKEREADGKNLLLPCAICQSRNHFAWLIETDQRMLIICDSCLQK
jgi:hypothetical protein